MSIVSRMSKMLDKANKIADEALRLSSDLQSRCREIKTDLEAGKPKRPLMVKFESIKRDREYMVAQLEKVDRTCDLVEKMIAETEKTQEQVTTEAREKLAALIDGIHLLKAGAAKDLG